jgi:hypothetical protein
MLAVMGVFFTVIAIVLSGSSEAESLGFLAGTSGKTLLLIGACTAALTYLFVRIAASRMERMEWKA